VFSRVAAGQSIQFGNLNQIPPLMPEETDDTKSLDYDNIDAYTSLDAFKEKSNKYIEKKMAPIVESIKKQKSA